MTKADIVEKVYGQINLPKKECADLVEHVFDVLKHTLERGEDVKVSGFGKFEVRDKTARRGRNPHTGEEMVIKARKVLTFKPSQILRMAVNASSL